MGFRELLVSEHREIGERVVLGEGMEAPHPFLHALPCVSSIWPFLSCMLL